MAGTKEGAKKAVAKILARDPNFYKNIGRKGGARGTTGGFAARLHCTCADVIGGHFVSQCAGKRGGTISRKNAAEKAA